MIGTPWVINKRASLSLSTSKMHMPAGFSDTHGLGPGGVGRAGLDSVLIVAPYGPLVSPKFV